MDFHFRALLFTTVVTCHQICVLGTEDLLRNPERIYKMHPSLTRDSLFTRTIQRPNTNSVSHASAPSICTHFALI